MHKDDMIRLAREAGWEYANGDDGYSPLWKFGELVAAAEREACAKLFDGEVWAYDYREIAAAIRARGQG
jgi:hypothetical protein